MIPPPKRQLLRQRPKTTPEPRRQFLPAIPPGIDPRKHPALWHLLPAAPEPSADPEDPMRLALEAMEGEAIEPSTDDPRGRR